MKKLLPFFLLLALLVYPGCGAVTQELGNEDLGNETMKTAPIPKVEEKHTFDFVGFAIERPPDVQGSYIMADVHKQGDLYRMYYTLSAPDHTSINMAVSQDALTWEDKGVVLDGAEETTDREFIIGGPSVVALPDGGYRMYYRASEYAGINPNYHIRSAYSDDGVTFAREEGVHMEIQPHDPDSEFTLVGHSRMYVKDDGTFAAIVTANTTEDDGPSDLHVATSKDGFEWEIRESLYQDWHDPAITMMDGNIYLHATYLKDKKGFAISKDGLHWSAEMQEVEFLDENGEEMTIDQYGLGDVATFTTDNGEMLMYTNYGDGVASDRIAIFKLRK